MNAINTANVTKIDTRDEITLWGLLVWSYKSQMVRLSQPTDMERHLDGYGGSSMTAVVCSRMESGLIGGFGQVHNQTSSAHDDANIIHQVLEYTLKPYDANFMISRAESGTIPDKQINVQLGKLVPATKANGKPKTINCPVKQKPIACKLLVEGWTWEEREEIQISAREVYSRWYELLVILYNEIYERSDLIKWKVTTIGVDPQPWKKIIHKVA